MRGADKARALRSWQNLNQALRRLSVAECHELLELETQARRRPSYIRRLIQRVANLEAKKIVDDLEAKYKEFLI